IRSARSRISGEYFWFIVFHPCFKNGTKPRPIHLDPVDIATVPIPRFSRREENRIAKLVSEAAELRDQADHDENLATSLAEAAIGDFLVYGVDGQD
ncbi:hypothetical protein H8Z60_31745, partial [Mycolicibacterium fortuitum]|nr:hypothetical protein [Mycolicibacterium fortuitum]